jgi:hypothetical protein
VVLTAGGCSAARNADVQQGSATAPQGQPPAADSAVPRQSIVFDTGHGEIFGPDDTTELGQSAAVERMRQSGFDVKVNPDQITAEDLAGASGLMIAGPMRPLLREEYVAINDFLKQGGVLLMTIHVPFPVLAVPAHWGLPVVPFVITANEPLPGQTDPGVLIADGIADNRLTRGVRDFFVLSGWPVEASSGTSAVVVKTGPETWIDADNNRSQEPSETGEFGVVGTAGVGKGSVIVVGDDAVFANIGINQADNMTLLDNILQLMHSALES